MPKLVLTVPDSGNAFASVGLGKSLAIPELRDGALYGAYLLGSGYDTVQDEKHDWSGNSRTLVNGRFGGPVVGEDYCDMKITSGHFATPFTGAQLAAANGEYSYAIVCKWPTGTNQTKLVSTIPASPSGAYTAMVSNGANLSMQVNDGANNVYATIGTPAAPGSLFALYVGTATATRATLYQRRTGISLLSATGAKTSGAIGGSNAFLIGGSYSVSNPTITTAAAAFWNVELTADEIEDTLFPSLVETLAAYGVTL